MAKMMVLEGSCLAAGASEVDRASCQAREEAWQVQNRTHFPANLASQNHPYFHSQAAKDTFLEVAAPVGWGTVCSCFGSHKRDSSLWIN